MEGRDITDHHYPQEEGEVDAEKDADGRGVGQDVDGRVDCEKRTAEKF